MAWLLDAFMSLSFRLIGDKSLLYVNSSNLLANEIAVREL